MHDENYKKVLDKLDTLPSKAFYLGMFVALFIGVVLTLIVMMD